MDSLQLWRAATKARNSSLALHVAIARARLCVEASTFEQSRGLVHGLGAGASAELGGVEEGTWAALEGAEEGGAELVGAASTGAGAAGAGPATDAEALSGAGSIGGAERGVVQALEMAPTSANEATHRCKYGIELRIVAPEGCARRS